MNENGDKVQNAFWTRKRMKTSYPNKMFHLIAK